MSEVVTRGRFYPDLPPRLVGETPDLPAWCTPAFMDKLVEALVPWMDDKVVDYPTGFISVFKLARYAAENVVPVVLAAIAAERTAVGRAVFGGGTPGRSGPTVVTVFGGAGGATPGANGQPGQSAGGGVGGAGGRGGGVA